jgi:hypothetical protein
MTTPLDEAVERHGEALFNLSDSIRESGMLDSDKHHQRYEATVKAWNDLRTILNALSPDEERVATMRNTIILILDANYHTAISKARSTADQIIQSIVGERDD